MIEYVNRFQKVFKIDPSPKNSPTWPKKDQKGQNWDKIKKKDRAIIPKPKLTVYMSMSQERLGNTYKTKVYMLYE